MASADREIKFDEILRSLLDRQKATLTQKKLATALGVSGTTVSHYVTGRIRPSFHALVGIAMFFNVTLDYLVFGERVPQPLAIDTDNLRTDVQRALAESNAHQGRQRDLIVRVNRRLHEHVEQIAQELLNDPKTITAPGFLTAAEALAIEACASRTRVMVRTAPADLAMASDGELGRGAFFEVLSNNILAGRTYQYLFHGRRAKFEPYVQALRDLLSRSDVPMDLVNAQVDFRVIEAELPAGVVIHDLDVASFERREPILWERLHHDGIRGSAFGYVTIFQQGALGGIMLHDSYFSSAQRMFDRNWGQARSL